MTLFELEVPPVSNITPFRTQLLKWVGNKQRFAHEIAGYFPELSQGATYFEPFLGSAAVLATFRPSRAVGSDVVAPLIGIFQQLTSHQQTLTKWYESRWRAWFDAVDRRAVYEAIRRSYNNEPNAADLVFLSRACYGGVVRFRMADGHMSTPMGAHMPISPESFSNRVAVWAERLAGTEFRAASYETAFEQSADGDFIYCDPPYTHTQSILYGAQQFKLPALLEQISMAKEKGVKVALSIDGSKTSGRQLLELPLPSGLFEREAFVTLGGSMLKRFQMSGQTQDEKVLDRLLLTY